MGGAGVGGEQMMNKKFGLERKGKLTFVKVTSKFLGQRTDNIIIINIDNKAITTAA